MKASSHSALRILKKICGGVRAPNKYEQPFQKHLINLGNKRHLISPIPFNAWFGWSHRQTSQATSARDGCRDAARLIEDGVDCPLARLLTKWGNGGREERCFSRRVFCQKVFHGCNCLLKCPQTVLNVDANIAR